MAEAACANLSGRLETEVTSRFISCSMLSWFIASGDALESGCWANPGSAKQTRPNVRSIDVAAATVLGSAIGPPRGCYHCAPGRRSRRSVPAQVAVLAGGRGDPCHPDRRRLTGRGEGIGPQVAGPLGKC